jgi:hypothetical protein
MNAWNEDARRRRNALALRAAFVKPRLVGAAGFEPTTPCPPGRCATRLRYAPTCGSDVADVIVSERVE